VLAPVGNGTTLGGLAVQGSAVTRAVSKDPSWRPR
jgi:hypothetical protein